MSKEVSMRDFWKGVYELRPLGARGWTFVETGFDFEAMKPTEVRWMVPGSGYGMYRGLGDGTWERVLDSRQFRSSMTRKHMFKKLKVVFDERWANGE